MAFKVIRGLGLSKSCRCKLFKISKMQSDLGPPARIVDVKQAISPIDPWSMSEIAIFHQLRLYRLEIYLPGAVEKPLRNSGMGGRFGRDVYYAPVVASIAAGRCLRSTGNDPE